MSLGFHGFKKNKDEAADIPFDGYIIKDGVVKNGFVLTGAPYTLNSGYISFAPTAAQPQTTIDVSSVDTTQFKAVVFRVRQLNSRAIDITVSPFGYTALPNNPNQIQTDSYAFNYQQCSKIACGTSASNNYDIFDIYFTT